MSVESRPGVAEYITSTFVLTIGFALVIAVFTSPAISWASGITQVSGGYAVVAVASFALVLSQLAVQGELDGESESRSLLMTGLGVIIAIAYYNIIIMISVVIASVAGGVFGHATGLMIAVLWPAWEFTSARNLIPLSVTGIAVWFVIIGVWLGIIGRSMVDLIRDAGSRPVRWVDIRRYGRNLG